MFSVYTTNVVFTPSYLYSSVISLELYYNNIYYDRQPARCIDNNGTRAYRGFP